jgi:hypothetical protein
MDVLSNLTFLAYTVWNGTGKETVGLGLIGLTIYSFPNI